ncbi:MAG: hypothetical protein F6J92_31355, partial [Symploca sp. SIO1A3]|nr:hypothetical protein [Symploca sp. SIO1A3]
MTAFKTPAKTTIDSLPTPESREQVKTTTTNPLPAPDSRERVKEFMQQLQDKICDALV